MALLEDHVTARLKKWGQFKLGCQVHTKSSFGFTFNQNLSELVSLFSNLVM